MQFCIFISRCLCIYLSKRLLWCFQQVLRSVRNKLFYLAPTETPTVLTSCTGNIPFAKKWVILYLGVCYLDLKLLKCARISKTKLERATQQYKVYFVTYMFKFLKRTEFIYPLQKFRNEDLYWFTSQRSIYIYICIFGIFLQNLDIFLLIYPFSTVAGGCQVALELFL